MHLTRLVPLVGDISLWVYLAKAISSILLNCDELVSPHSFLFTALLIAFSIAALVTFFAKINIFKGIGLVTFYAPV
jgi:hypothetical protein